MTIRTDVKIIKADLTQHDFIYFVPLSDFHWDEPQSDHEAIQGYVDWIKDHDNAYTMLNGDLFTLVGLSRDYGDVYERGEPGELIELMPPDRTLDELTDLLQPIAERILASCSGGHELKNMFKAVGADYTYRLMKNLGRERLYVRDGGLLLMKTKPLTSTDDTFFSAIFTHGWGSARTRGAKIRKLEYLSQGFDVDMVIMSHDHTQNLTRDNVLYVPSWDAERLSVRRTMLIATGGFRGFGGYPLRSGYQPADLGTPRIRIGKKVDECGSIRKDIHASI